MRDREKSKTPENYAVTSRKALCSSGCLKRLIKFGRGKLSSKERRGETGESDRTLLPSGNSSSFFPG